MSPTSTLAGRSTPLQPRLLRSVAAAIPFRLWASYPTSTKAIPATATGRAPRSTRKAIRSSTSPLSDGKKRRPTASGGDGPSTKWSKTIRGNSTGAHAPRAILRATSSACKRWATTGFIRPHGETTTAPRTKAARTHCTRWTKTKPSAGSPAASNELNCRTSTTTSRLYQQVAERSQTGYGESRSTSWRRFSRIAGSIPRRPTLASQHQGIRSRFATIKKQRWRKLSIPGAASKILCATGGQRGHGRIPFPQRRSKSISSATPIKVGQAARRREGVPQVRSRPTDYAEGTTSATSAIDLSSKTKQQYLADKPAPSGISISKPRDNHFDKRVTVTTPLQKPGAYLLTAEMAGGNTSKIIIWVSDTAIVKNAARQGLLLRRRRRSGKPVSKANLEFFGYKMIIAATGDHRSSRRTSPKPPTPTDRSSPIRAIRKRLSMADYRAHRRGRVRLPRIPGVWDGRYYDRRLQRHEGLFDHRSPGLSPAAIDALQVLGAARAVRQRRRFAVRQSQFSGELYSPKGEKLWTKSLQTDEYGGCEGNWEIPEDATLGRYRVDARKPATKTVATWPAATAMFRVEEYKKPEFEVSSRPRRTGDAWAKRSRPRFKRSTTSARPSPMGTVKYKIQRTPHSQDWFPIMYWDWFYGKGYWWFATTIRGIPAGASGLAAFVPSPGGIRGRTLRPNWSPRTR
jgi:hypothetical protein